MFVHQPYVTDGTMPLSNCQWQEEQYSSHYSNSYDYWEDPQLYMPRHSEELQKFNSPPEPIQFEPPGIITAVGKSSSLMDALYIKREDIKPMKQWSPDEVIEWLCEEANKHRYEYEKIHLAKFYVDGCTLLRMTEHQFIENDPHAGFLLFQSVESRRKFEESQENLPPFHDIRQTIEHENRVYTDISEPLPYKNMTSDIDSDQSDSSSRDIKDVIIKTEDVLPKPPLRKVGRPPKVGRTKRGNKEKKCGRLWEFIRDLLKKPEYCPSLICWENHDEGVFRFVRSDKVAELWGTIKDNPKMTYEKLSRAMRYYYKSKVLQPVLGRRLVYKFGPTARDWRTDNPNFRDVTK